MVYEWKVPIYKIPAQEAGGELERITNKFGVLTPELVVEESRSETAVLHSCFEWDDQKAADKYRVVQAHQILRTITARIPSNEGAEPVAVRAFVHIDGNYESVAKAIVVPDMYQSLLNDAMKEMESFRQKYRNIQELSGVILAMEAVSTEK